MENSYKVEETKFGTQTSHPSLSFKRKMNYEK